MDKINLDVDCIKNPSIVDKWGIKQENNMKTLKSLTNIQYALDQSAIVAITDQSGKIIYANNQFCRISQYELQELIGQDHRILNSGYHPKSFFKNMWATIGKGDVWKAEIQNRAKDGTYYWVDTTIVPFLNTHGKPYQYVSIRYDITNRKKIEEELRNSEEKYRLITENSPDMILTMDKTGDINYMSPAYENFLGNLPKQERNLYNWIYIEDRQNLAHHADAVFSGMKKYSQLEVRFQKKEQTFINTETRITPIIDDMGNIEKVVLVVRDVTERKSSEKLIYRLANRDNLTELPNRRSFLALLKKEIQKATDLQYTLGIMSIDLDKFKTINDTHGNEAGDLILIKAVSRLRECLGSTYVIARMGGDDFTVLLPNIDDKDSIARVAQRILESFQDAFELDGIVFTISCSIGIALYPADGRGVNELLKHADAALHDMKKKGGNGFLFFHSDMEQKSLEDTLLENELRNAIKQQQFYIEYQPKIDLSTNELVGIEALVRWNHPDLGSISPGKFIPIAEETGLIVPLGEWVLHQGCKQNKEWQNQGYNPVRLSVNLSIHQLNQSNLLENIKRVLNETGLDANWLELEVTESVFADLDHSVDILKEIRDLGVQISIDDFGTGYSSFSYIKHLPIDTLKIDASFIRDIDTNDESKAIVKGIIGIAQTLNFGVIAEGVENVEQAHSLREYGCDQGQGFLFSKPLSSEDFVAFMQGI